MAARRAAKGANFRLIVSGPIGVKEIDPLIQNLQIDKEILADQDEGPDDDDGANATAIKPPQY
ncbi:MULTISPECIES: hypothetical protein [unclassified Tardiphaga]|uniref:hypothetical protein n=1 Tax=unclassified Tardiphaga TaxID=2631404 RepID=UPI00143D53DE|nr:MULTISPECIES: hypothetical protein [unclassified Tardiphaga]